jgi:hypothetical protein
MPDRRLSPTKRGEGGRSNSSRIRLQPFTGTRQGGNP